MEKPPIVLELERCHRAINDKMFAGNLKPAAFVLQPKKKVGIRWTPDTGFLIGSDFCNLEYSEVARVLLHEMIHQMNAQNGVVDCTANQYHNKFFLRAALEVGLVVIKHKTQGWGITTTIYPRNVVERDCIRKPSRESEKLLADTVAILKLDKGVFKAARIEMRQCVKKEKPAKNFFLKYICNCPPPHNSIRSGRRPDGPNALDIVCRKCHSIFRCVSDLKPETDET